jgi:hypothetical protein
MPETEVDTFAGIDVSARELSVALRRGKDEDKPVLAKFSNHPSGHKALIAHLLWGGRRVRVCLGHTENGLSSARCSPPGAHRTVMNKPIRVQVEKDGEPYETATFRGPGDLPLIGDAWDEKHVVVDGRRGMDDEEFYEVILIIRTAAELDRALALSVLVRTE